MQVGFLHGISFVSFFRYTINAFIRLQYAERDDGCGLLPAVAPEQVCTTHTQSIHPTGFDQNSDTVSLWRHCLCWPSKSACRQTNNMQMTAVGLQCQCTNLHLGCCPRPAVFCPPVCMHAGLYHAPMDRLTLPLII